MIFFFDFLHQGVPALLQDITRVTLEQKYMGEQIPEAWLSLEKRLLKHREEKKDLLPWRDVEKEASACGLIENVEVRVKNNQMKFKVCLAVNCFHIWSEM